MARTIELLDNQRVVRLTGWTRMAAQVIAARAGAPLRTAEVVPAPDPRGARRRG
jgi:hypothetical protein